LVAYFSFDNKDKSIQLHQVTYIKGHSGNALYFSGENSTTELPYKEIGYDYTVSFWINPAENNTADAVIFRSANSVVKLKQGNTDNLGFSRDGYNFDFSYHVPENTWTHIVIAGTNKGTSLYVNGQLQKKLYDDFFPATATDKTKKQKVETLFFPLQTVGGFYGKIDELRIWNKVFSDQEIAGLK